MTRTSQQARSQVLRFGGQIQIYGGKIFVIWFNKEFSRHNTKWGALPQIATPWLRAWITGYAQLRLFISATSEAAYITYNYTKAAPS